MESRSQYIIQFASLQAGEHNFEYQVTDKFFEPYERSLIKKADIRVKVTLLKGVNNLQLTFEFNGSIQVDCARCLDEFNLPVKEVRHLLVRQLEEAAPNGTEEEEDIISLPFTAHELDLEPHIYDYLNLMVPLYPVHPDLKGGIPGCDPASLETMSKYLQRQADENDPRWDILKNLKLK